MKINCRYCGYTPKANEDHEYFRCYLKWLSKKKKFKKKGGYKYGEIFGRPRKDYITVRQKAKNLGVSVPTFYKRIKGERNEKKQ